MMIFISPESRFFALQQDMVRLESGPFPLLKSSCDGIGQNFRHIPNSLNLLTDQAASLGAAFASFVLIFTESTSKFFRFGPTMGPNHEVQIVDFEFVIRSCIKKWM